MDLIKLQKKTLLYLIKKKKKLQFDFNNLSNKLLLRFFQDFVQTKTHSQLFCAKILSNKLIFFYIICMCRYVLCVLCVNNTSFKDITQFSIDLEFLIVLSCLWLMKPRFSVSISIRASVNWTKGYVVLDSPKFWHHNNKNTIQWQVSKIRLYRFISLV